MHKTTHTHKKNPHKNEHTTYKPDTQECSETEMTILDRRTQRRVSMVGFHSYKIPVISSDAKISGCLGPGGRVGVG